MSINAISGLDRALQAVSAVKSSTSTDAGSTLGAASGTPADSTHVSGPGQLLAKLEQLRQSDPSKFKQVMSSLSDTLAEEAKSSSDPRGQKMLSELSAKFKAAGESGDLSGLTPPQHGPGGGRAPDGTPPAGGPPHGGAHHGGHAKGAKGGASSNATGGGQTDPADTNQDGIVSASEALAYQTAHGSDDSSQSSSAKSYEKMADHGREKMESTFSHLLAIVDAA